jgi:Asp-tRNA(Asn)/Glu-tRNA(Gln) amidotransferase A subunit family amidase
MENGFLDIGIKGILEAYVRGEMTPVDTARICARQIELHEASVHAMVCYDLEKLVSQAEEGLKRIEKGLPARQLEGIPVGIKDIFNTMDFPTQMGSPIWKDFTPGNDARILYQIRKEGGIIPGKTVTAEFAVHTPGETANPHDPSKTPGTSSSGSAAGIATGMFPAATGTQTAGSIVRPASFCGVYGCKPSFGLIPRTGSLKTTDSLDTTGFFVAHAEDMLTMFNVLRVHGKNYPLSDSALSDTKRQAKKEGEPWRVAFVKPHVWEHAHGYAREAVTAWVKGLADDSDIEITETDLPESMRESHDVHSTIYDCALSYYFQEEHKRKELVSPIMNSLIERGLEITPEQYRKALVRQEELADDMDYFFNEVDIMVTLSTAGAAPPANEVERPDSALMWTLTHLPVISAPLFISPDGLPFGAQIVARRYNDLKLFRFMDYLLERELAPEGAFPRIGT